MIEKRLINQVKAIFSQLSAPVTLFDAQGNCLIPAQGPLFTRLEELDQGQQVRIGGKYCLLTVNQPQVIICMDEMVPGVQDMLMMAGILYETICQNGGVAQSGSDVYRYALLEKANGAEMEALAHEHQIPMELNRCVLLFQIVQTENASAYSLLSEIVPRSDEDAFVEMDRHVVALIKDMNLVEDLDELEQLAQAVSETLMSETAHQVIVGIGLPRHALASLGESYREAVRAVEVGRIFRPQEGIYQFRNLMLERFLTEIPRDTSTYYHNLLFNRKNQRLFNEEMLYTIEMFFKKDLNLSDTARQLYIHRNTLVYRLDKVQRQVGLDLRKFEDAVTFKILLELKRCVKEKPANIH